MSDVWSLICTYLWGTDKSRLNLAALMESKATCKKLRHAVTIFDILAGCCMMHVGCRQQMWVKGRSWVIWRTCVTRMHITVICIWNCGIWPIVDKDDATVQLVLHAVLMTSTMCRCAAMSVMRTREIKEGLLRSIDRRQLLSSRCVRNMRLSPGYTPFAWWSADVSEMQTARNI